MQVIIGFLILLLFYFAGQVISYFIGGFIPGNIIGMILLFCALYFNLLKPARIKSISTGLTRNMAIFFVPAGVGLLESLDLLKQYWFSITVVSAISTIFVIVVVGLIQEKMETRRKDYDKII